MKSFQFKIQIKGITKPPVWRRLLVPADITFHTFHQIIQTAFGWENSHLYQFSLKGWGSLPSYKIPDDEDYIDEVEHSQIIRLLEVFNARAQTFTYIYDFGDDWKHSILLEEILEEGTNNAVCLAGQGACPPENCGGVPGYAHLIEVLADPKNPEYKDLRRWLGITKKNEWDVNAFDLETVNSKLKALDI